MQESVIYQEILQQGVQQGRIQGRQEAGMALVLRQLERRFSQLPSELRSQIQQLSIAQLEGLSEALLDFSSTQDLVNWLQNEASE